jgi:hypothetical protein
MSGRQLLPLTGILAVVVIVIAFIVGGEPPDSDASVAEVVEFYEDNDDETMIGGALVAWGAVLFLFFASALRRALRAAEVEAGGLSALSFAGAIVFAVGIAIFAAIGFSLGDAATDLEPATVQTLHVMNVNFFFPAAVGLSVFLLGTGIAAIKTGALPKWLGWIAILVGIVAVTPAGFVAFLLNGLFVIVVSVMLVMRAGDDRPTGPNTGAATPTG